MTELMAAILNFLKKNLCFLISRIEHEDYEHTDVIVYYNGQLFWIPPTTTHTSCDFDFTYWPWDIQKCQVVLGSWTKSGNELDVVNMDHSNVCNESSFPNPPLSLFYSSQRKGRER